MGMVDKYYIMEKGYTRYACTYLNAFLMVITNKGTEFQNFDIFENFVTFSTCRLLTPEGQCDGYEILPRSFTE